MISKKKFEETYRKFSPSKCELFYMKYLTVSSLSQNIVPAIVISLSLMLPFIFAVIANILNWPMTFTYIPSFIYAGLLALIGVYSYIIWHKKTTRIKSICKELGIDKKKYEELVDKYYYHNYFPDIKDYIISILPD
jgi:hypothetical protein